MVEQQMDTDQTTNSGRILKPKSATFPLLELGPLVMSELVTRWSGVLRRGPRQLLLQGDAAAACQPLVTQRCQEATSPTSPLLTPSNATSVHVFNRQTAGNQVCTHPTTHPGHSNLTPSRVSKACSGATTSTVTEGCFNDGLWGAGGRAPTQDNTAPVWTRLEWPPPPRGRFSSCEGWIRGGGGTNHIWNQKESGKTCW